VSRKLVNGSQPRIKAKKTSPLDASSRAQRATIFSTLQGAGHNLSNFCAMRMLKPNCSPEKSWGSPRTGLDPFFGSAYSPHTSNETNSFGTKNFAKDTEVNRLIQSHSKWPRHTRHASLTFAANKSSTTFSPCKEATQTGATWLGQLIFHRAN
jgi:hypothetical protein